MDPFKKLAATFSCLAIVKHSAHSARPTRVPCHNKCLLLLFLIHAPLFLIMANIFKIA
jgi:hypothetical protein